jgi:hypothetical protein
MICWVLAVLVIIILAYVAMLLDTNSVMSYVFSVMNGEMPRSELAGKPVYMLSGHQWPEATQWKISLTRLFVVHNFRDGIIWAVYNHYGYDEFGKHVGGGRNIHSKWTIHKENGKWDIVRIDEAP